jgi:hypothetical protein
MPMIAKTAALALAAVLAAPQSSLAQSSPPESRPASSATPADCVWAATTPAMRDAMLAAAPNPQAILNAITDEDAVGLANACRLPDDGDSAFLVVTALRGHVLIDWAKDQLKGPPALDEAALDAGWARLPAATRELLAAGLQAGFRPPDSVAIDLDALARALRIQSDDGKFALFAYAVGRAGLQGLAGG